MARATMIDERAKISLRIPKRDLVRLKWRALQEGCPNSQALVLRRREATSKDAPAAPTVESWRMLRDAALPRGSLSHEVAGTQPFRRPHLGDYDILSTLIHRYVELRDGGPNEKGRQRGSARHRCASPRLAEHGSSEARSAPSSSRWTKRPRLSNSVTTRAKPTLPLRAPATLCSFSARRLWPTSLSSRNYGQSIGKKRNPRYNIGGG